MQQSRPARAGFIQRFLTALGLAAILAPWGSNHGFALDLGPRCDLLKIDSVYFEDGGKRGWYLYVGGLRRFANMDVGFEHHQYRGGMLTVTAVGCTANFAALPIPTPYTIELPLRDIPGARRIRIVGANGSVTRRLPGR